MTKTPFKTALEATVEQHTKQIDGIGDTMGKLLDSIQGLRDDMSERGEKMIMMLTDQNLALIKNGTDHEAKDVERFSSIHSKINYFLGCGVGGGALISFVLAIAAIYYNRH